MLSRITGHGSAKQSLQVSEGCKDRCADARPTDSDTRDEWPLLREILSDAIQPGQVDDAQAEADEDPGGEVEEVDGGHEGAEHEAGRGDDGADDGGEPPADLVSEEARHRTWQEHKTSSFILSSNVYPFIYLLFKKNLEIFKGQIVIGK